MVLHKSLVDADIPGCDKVREAIISYWKVLFEELKHELSVGFNSFSSHSTS
jgi:hypothetical protein